MRRTSGESVQFLEQDEAGTVRVFRTPLFHKVDRRFLRVEDNRWGAEEPGEDDVPCRGMRTRGHARMRGKSYRIACPTLPSCIAGSP